MKKENPTSINSPNILKCYWIASRPKTWTASICPVLIGTSLAFYMGFFSLPIFILTLLFSLCIQIGTNFANDYFDFIKGADTEMRKGPQRATQQGWIPPSDMLRASLLAFSFALFFAIPLMLMAGLWSWGVALLCILFGLLYTGGPKPLGYVGLGEILVFVFFGPVAICGTYFLQTGEMDFFIFLASLSPALLSTAILVANNLRDETSDRIANKKTLVVRWGRKFGSYEYAILILFASIIPSLLALFHLAPLSLTITSLILVPAVPLIKKGFCFKDPLELIALLQGTSFLLLIYTLLFCAVFLETINDLLW